MRNEHRMSRYRQCFNALAKPLAFFLIAGLTLSGLSVAQDASVHANWQGPGQLFMGTCYQPIDRSSEQIDRDIAIMKGAGFNVVRMGDLSWDSFEPEDGRFDFAWLDRVLDKMQANGIRVILDIPGSPAPIWLHRKYPGVDIVTQNGTRLPPAERYMDDIGDPDYVREVAIMADTLTKRYAHHPAIIAVGYDNEIGNGFMSYSEADRQRFIAWLKTKYGTIEKLNKSWATQRWSRRLNRFEDVDLPLADGPGPSERYLDLHRYWSDEAVARLQELDAIRRRNTPDLPSISNLWDTASRRGFDYLSNYKSYVSYGAEGFYPGDPIGGAFGALTVKGDLTTPIWFNEFTAGGGGYYGTPGRSRMYGYLGLLIGAQGFLAWTFNSHLGGEEQALFWPRRSRWHALVEGRRVQPDGHRVQAAREVWLSTVYASRDSHCVFIRFLRRFSPEWAEQYDAPILQALLYRAGSVSLRACLPRQSRRSHHPSWAGKSFLLQARCRASGLSNGSRQREGT